MESWEVSLADQNIYLQSAYTKSFPKNYRILKGEQCRGLVLILDGALRTFIVSPNDIAWRKWENFLKFSRERTQKQKQRLTSVF